ncbi:MAG: type IV pilus modification PilV family protein [Thermodesulfobacteriota bacterium]
MEKNDFSLKIKNLEQQMGRLQERRNAMNEKGFTLIEVLIGMVILSVGLLGLTGLQVSATRGNFFSKNITMATCSGQAGLECLAAMDIASAALQPGKHNDTPVETNGLAFNRSYTVTMNGNLRRINYTITWNDGTDRTISFSTFRFQ